MCSVVQIGGGGGGGGVCVCGGGGATLLKKHGTERYAGMLRRKIRNVFGFFSYDNLESFYRPPSTSYNQMHSL